MLSHFVDTKVVKFVTLSVTQVPIEVAVSDKAIICKFDDEIYKLDKFDTHGNETISGIKDLNHNDNYVCAVLNDKGIDHLSFMGFNKHIAEDLKNGTRLDLVVRHTNPNDEGLKNGWLKNAERVVYRDSATPDSQIGMANIRPDNARSMFWVFEDVKFLGWNDGLEFGHTSTGCQELTTDFIFKRLIRVDPMYLENYLGGTIGKAFELTSINDSVISSELKIKSNYEKV